MMLRRHSIATALLVAGLAALGGPVGAASAVPTCAKKAGEIKRVGGGVIWTTKGYLWGCTAFSGDKPETFRLGPWSKKSRYAYDAGRVVWTVPKAGKAGTEDAVWEASAVDGVARLTGVRPTTGKGSSTDVRVARLLTSPHASAWVTTKGTVVASLQADGDPEAVGTSPGLVTPFVLKGGRYVVGRWPEAAGSTFAQTLDIAVGDGEGDDCGGSDPYTVTVRPVADADPVGLTAFVGYVTLSDACNG